MDEPHVAVKVNRVDDEDPAIAKLRRVKIIHEEQKKEQEKGKRNG